jgi:hypothetical protein
MTTNCSRKPNYNNQTNAAGVLHSVNGEQTKCHQVNKTTLQHSGSSKCSKQVMQATSAPAKQVETKCIGTSQGEQWQILQ